VLPRLGKAWNAFLGFAVGYGYQTWRAAVAIVALVALGTVVFAAAYPGDFAAAKSNGPGFNALIYSVDVLVPVINLGQRDAWIATGAVEWWTFFFKLAGWVLSTAVVAGVTSVLRRD
jgi:hypothetical protein